MEFHAPQVHDGDTVIVDPAGNLSVRFFGVDTPEVSFTLPKQALQAADRRPDESLFVPIADARWGASWPTRLPPACRGSYCTRGCAPT